MHMRIRIRMRHGPYLGSDDAQRGDALHVVRRHRDQEEARANDLVPCTLEGDLARVCRRLGLTLLLSQPEQLRLAERGHLSK